MRKIYCVVILLAALQGILSAQSVKDTNVFAVMIMPSFGVYIPAADMRERTNVMFGIGGSAMIKLKSNWVVGATGSFMFNETVTQEGLMDNLLPVIAGDGRLAGLSITMRGFSFFANAGKIIPISRKPNRNSGLLLMLGGGYLQHKIRIDATGLTPQAQGAYLKGYDRLTTGFALSQFVGYVYLDNKKIVNFFAGFEFIEAFTRNRRGFNYDTGQPDGKDRIDFLPGFRLGWIFPIYKRTVKGESDRYYYSSR